MHGGACEPAYPTICLPPAIGHPDLGRGNIADRSFTVLTPDPYRLDGRDRDGVGCESQRPRLHRSAEDTVEIVTIAYSGDGQRRSSSTASS